MSTGRGARGVEAVHAPFFCCSSSVMAALRSLDLFSGIGGLSLALKGLCEPLCYCEIEPAAQAVLQDQMRRGAFLPRRYAPMCAPSRLNGCVDTQIPSPTALLGASRARASHC